MSLINVTDLPDSDAKTILADAETRGATAVGRSPIPSTDLLIIGLADIISDLEARIAVLEGP